MTTITKYPLKKLAIFSLVAVGLFFIAGESLAQSERDKVEVENAKPAEKPILDHSVNIRDNSPKINPLHPAATINREKDQLVKKEGNVSGEGKKVETVPSTLSFNIFLYIVDKFKAD